MKCEECQTLIEEFFDGELDTDRSALVSAHISRCVDCQDLLEALQQEEEAVVAFAFAPEPSPAFWNAVQAEIEKEKRHEPAGWFANWHIQLERFLPMSLSSALVPAAVLVLLTLASGVVLFRHLSNGTQGTAKKADPGQQNQGYTPPASTQAPPDESGTRAALVPGSVAPSGPLPQPANTKNSGSKHVAPRNARRHSVDFAQSLAAGTKTPPTEVVFAPASFNSDDPETSKHVERVQLLLRSFRNSQLVGNQSELAFEKKLSRDLLSQNIFLRRNAEVAGDVPTAELLSNVEPLLLDIANMDQRPSSDDVSLIRDRIEKKEIVAALQVR
jgi:anti-sigma factor RsiW